MLDVSTRIRYPRGHRRAQNSVLFCPRDDWLRKNFMSRIHVHAHQGHTGEHSLWLGLAVWLSQRLIESAIENQKRSLAASGAT
jgi:hypothetical protein